MTERTLARFMRVTSSLVSTLCGVGIVVAFGVAPAYQRMSGFLLALGILSLGMAVVGWTQIRDLRGAKSTPKVPRPGVARAFYRAPGKKPESPVRPTAPFPRYRILGVALFMALLVGLCGWGVLAAAGDSDSGGMLILPAAWGVFLEIGFTGLLRRRPWAWRASFVALLSSAFFVAAIWIALPEGEPTTCFGIKLSILLGGGFLLLLAPLASLVSCHRSYVRATDS